MLESNQIETTEQNYQAVSESEICELHFILIRPTNYTNDGYQIKTRLGVICSNTLTQVGTLVRDLESDSFFNGFDIKIQKIDEATQ